MPSLRTQHTTTSEKKNDPGCARVKPNEPHLPMATQGPYGLHQPRMATFKGNLEPSCDGKKSIQKCKLVHQSKGLPLLWTSSPLSQHGSKKNSSFILPSIHPSSHPAIDQSVNRSLNLECTVSFKANPHSTLICKFQSYPNLFHLAVSLNMFIKNLAPLRTFCLPFS